MNVKNILIFGAAGQIGSYLWDFLCRDNNYKLFGHVRSRPNEYRGYHGANIYSCELTQTNIHELIQHIRPDYIFNFVSQSSVSKCTDLKSTIENNTLITGYILEAVSKCVPFCRILNAGSELETHNNNLYALSKSLAFQLISYYRNVHGIFAVQPIIFTNTSPRQKPHFFIPKIIQGAVNIKKSLLSHSPIICTMVGNIYLNYSWGHASDIAMACWKLLNLSKPQNLYLSGQQNYSGVQIISKVFDKLYIDYKLTSEGFSTLTNEPLVLIDQTFIRPNEKERICNQYSFEVTCKLLNWKPIFNIDTILQSMIDSYYGQSSKN